MGVYLPVRPTELNELQMHAESCLTDEPFEVDSRIAYFVQMTRDMGYVATFGAEVVCAYVDLQRTGNRREFEEMRFGLHLEAINEIQQSTGEAPQRVRRRVDPFDLLSPYNSPSSRGVLGASPYKPEVIEVRTEQADPWKTVEQYWQTIQALGTVARRNKVRAVILGSHINASVGDGYEEDNLEYMDFKDHESGGPVLAAYAQNLQALQLLQLDAGLKEGWQMFEAFPNKHTPVTILENEVVRNHTRLGLGDPRLDVLAFLSAVFDAEQGLVPDDVMGHVRKCRKMGFELDNGPNVTFLDDMVLWDRGIRHLVLPQQLDLHAMSPLEQVLLREFASRVSSVGRENRLDMDAQLLAETIQRMKIRRRGAETGRIDIAPTPTYAKRLGPHFATVGYELGDGTQRVTAFEHFDDPGRHDERRRDIAGNDLVRKILGDDVLVKLTPPEVAQSNRQRLLGRRSLAGVV